VLDRDYLECRREFEPGKLLVYTGPIDAFFSYELGRLAYRGQRREHEYLPEVGFRLPCGQVNNPSPAAGDHLRTLEWKHMMPPSLAEGIQGTVITRETTVAPSDANDYEYTFPDHQNTMLYRAYRKRAQAIPNVLICGRLGEYRYYDMDQAIARARSLAKRILRGLTAGPS
jgi:UDP-galactopyranose mutase